MTQQSISMEEGLEPALAWSAWSQVRGCGGGVAGFAPALRAPPVPRAEGDTAADRQEKPCPTRTRGTAVTPVLAMVMVSRPPSPGPPACAMVVVRRWATADDDRQQHVNMRSPVSSGSARPTTHHHRTRCIANLHRAMTVMELARVLLCVCVLVE